MRCPQCVEAGLTSTVTDHPTKKIPGRVHTFWDDEDRRHVHSAAVVITPLSCSQGHKWKHEGRTACPTCGVPTAP